LNWTRLANLPIVFPPSPSPTAFFKRDPFIVHFFSITNYLVVWRNAYKIATRFTVNE
jgi:hypothetical protein